MTRHVALAALMLAACSNQPQADATPTRTPEATPHTAARQPATAKTDAPVTPKPGVLKTFGDWQVGCDNGLVCTMASLLPDDGAGAGATLNLTRDPGPQGRYHAILGEGVTDASGRKPAVRFTVDGRDLGRDANALAAAMANGRVLKVPGGTISLKGASAALRYIDAMQGRAGTVTATVATGAKPAASVPPAPALPIVAAQRLTPYTAKLPPSVVATMKRIGRCDLSEGMDSTPSVARTPDGRLLAEATTAKSGPTTIAPTTSTAESVSTATAPSATGTRRRSTRSPASTRRARIRRPPSTASSTAISTATS